MEPSCRLLERVRGANTFHRFVHVCVHCIILSRVLRISLVQNTKHKYSGKFHRYLNVSHKLRRYLNVSYVTCSEEEFVITLSICRDRTSRCIRVFFLKSEIVYEFVTRTHAVTRYKTVQFLLNLVPRYNLQDGRTYLYLFWCWSTVRRVERPYDASIRKQTASFRAIHFFCLFKLILVVSQ